MITASNLADAIGRKRIAEAVGVLPTAVSNAVVRGAFPSSWFPTVKALAEAEGQDCPISLFAMGRRKPRNVDAKGQLQEAAPQKLTKKSARART